MIKYSKIYLRAAALAAAVLLASCAAWPEVDYAEVRAYAYNLKGDTSPPIITNGRLHPSVTSKSGASLTPAQVRRLHAAVNGRHPSHPIAACFEPRHAFVFYDSARKPRAWLEVCFECLSFESTPGVIKGYLDFPALAELCAELRLPASPDPDFRKDFDKFRRRRPPKL